MMNDRDSVMAGLLDACAKILAERGMSGMFVDRIKGSEGVFQSRGRCFSPRLSSSRSEVARLLIPGLAGFKKWATYRDDWRKV